MPSPVVEIQPINNIMLCANVPFDSTYTHTCLFGSVGAQHSYFASKAKYTWSNLTPSRYPNKIRLPISTGEAYACNYLCFQNANFSPKWFYCFLHEIEYVNPEVCFVTVKLDVFQTWQFDFNVGTSYVVREHPLTDNYGEHTLGEPLENAEFVDEASTGTGHMDKYRAIVEYAGGGGSDSGGDSGGDGGGEDNGHGPGWENQTRETRATGQGTVGGTFTGLNYMSATLSGAGGGAILDLLESLNNSGKIDQIAATYLMPDDFYTTGSSAVRYIVNKTKNITTLGQYTPRNKKLLCYPYNMLCVSNSMGQVNSYKYEYFGGNAMNFTMSCAMGGNSDVILCPNAYNGKYENWEESLSLSGFPQFAYIIDTYRNWVAQNGASYGLSQMAGIVGGVGNVALSAATGNAMGAITGALNTGAAMAAWAEKSKMPNSSGGASASNTMVAIRAKDFYFYQHHIREDYAAAFDDYFDRFGYQTNRLKVPNLTGRPNYNYVKCLDPDIRGNIPLGDMDTIKNAFSRGITFWHNVSRVGDYSVANRPPGEGEV